MNCFALLHQPTRLCHRSPFHHLDHSASSEALHSMTRVSEVSTGGANKDAASAFGADSPAWHACSRGIVRSGQPLVSPAHRFIHDAKPWLHSCGQRVHEVPTRAWTGAPIRLATPSQTPIPGCSDESGLAEVRGPPIAEGRHEADRPDVASVNPSSRRLPRCGARGRPASPDPSAD